jgi:hypothetical protein
MLCSNQANFYTNPLKSETNHSSAFERFSVPIPNAISASTMSNFMSQLTVVSTSSFLHFHIPLNATSTATGLRFDNNSHQTSLNDVTTCSCFCNDWNNDCDNDTYLASRNAITKVPKKYQLDKCKATRTQHKTRSPSILHLAKKSAYFANPINLLLFFVRNDSAIMMFSLLLPRHFEHPAIMTVDWFSS